MAFWFGDGFDLYSVVADAQGYWDNVFGSMTVGLGSVGRFTGSRSLVLAGFSPAAGMTKTSGSNDSVHHIVVAVQQNSLPASTSTGIYFTLFDGATAQCTVGFRADGAVVLQSGNASGATLATYTGAVTSINTWFAFEIEVVIHNTAGSLTVRKNGNPSNDFTLGSLNTRGGTANNYANKIGIGANWNNTNGQWIDDFLWRSDAASVPWLGDIRCYTRMPASDASVQFSRTPTGVLTQTVPTSAPSTTAITNNLQRLTAVTAAYSGVVTGVSVAVSTGNSGNIKCAIYADSGTGLQPTTVLATAVAPVTPVAVGTNAFTFSPGLAVVKGTTYWLSVLADTNSGFYTNAASAAAGANASASYASFPQANPVVSTTQPVVQFSWTYTATPANWQAVSEAQQDAATSYVYDSTAGHADLYGISTIASTPVSTIAVVTRGYMQKSDAGSRTAAVQLKSGATTVASPTLTLTTSGWQWAWRTDVVDPNTSAAWTAAGVNGATIGPVVIS